MPYQLIPRLRSWTSQKRHQKLPALMVPILRLPPELVSQILIYTIGPCTSRVKDLHILAQVCKLWFSIIIGTPELWAFVDSSWPRSEWRLALKRSGNHPLDILVQDYPPHDAPWDPEHRIDFWRALIGCMPRWRTVHFNQGLGPTWRLDDEMLHDLERGSAPELVDFGVYVVPSISYKRAVDLFQGGAPKLRALHLSLVGLRNWTAPFLGSLTSLKLEGCLKGPTMGELEEILRLCSPTLEELALYEVPYHTLGITRISTSHLPIILKRLRSFTTCQLATDILPLLKTLKTPKCSEVVLQLDNWSENAPGTVQEALLAGGSALRDRGDMPFTSSRRDDYHFRRRQEAPHHSHHP